MDAGSHGEDKVRRGFGLWTVCNTTEIILYISLVSHCGLTCFAGFESSGGGWPGSMPSDGRVSVVASRHIAAFVAHLV